MLEAPLNPPVGMSWQGETGRLLCRWSDAGRRFAYTPPWATNPPALLEDCAGAAKAIDFGRLSLFGSAQWFGLQAHLRTVTMR